MKGTNSVWQLSTYLLALHYDHDVSFPDSLTNLRIPETIAYKFKISASEIRANANIIGQNAISILMTMPTNLFIGKKIIITHSDTQICFLGKKLNECLSFSIQLHSRCHWQFIIMSVQHSAILKQKMQWCNLSDTLNPIKWMQFEISAITRLLQIYNSFWNLGSKLCIIIIILTINSI